MRNSPLKATKWLISSAIVSAGLLVFLVGHFSLQGQRGPAVSCRAAFSGLSSLKTEGELTLDLEGSGRGRMNISANATGLDGMTRYRLLRNVTFEYTSEGNGYLTMQHLQVLKNVSDNMPDALFNESIFDISEPVRRLRVTTLGQSYLLWNAFSPALMCVTDS